MTSGRALMLTLAACCCVAAGTARADESLGSWVSVDPPVDPPAWPERYGTAPMGVAMFIGDQQPELVLAQRSIDRAWGLSEDSTYVEVDVPGWKSEPLAFSLSAAVPGLGHAYVGSPRGWIFAIAEAAGWTLGWMWSQRGDELHDEAVSYAGTPTDTTSRWTFDRFEAASGTHGAEIKALYVADRSVFYDRIGNDPRYLAGWEGEPTSTRSGFTELWTAGEDRKHYARTASAAIMVNHVVAGLDALRAARSHNLPIAPNMKMGWKASLSHGRPQIAMTLTRSF